MGGVRGGFSIAKIIGSVKRIGSMRWFNLMFIECPSRHRLLRGHPHIMIITLTSIALLLGSLLTRVLHLRSG
jgi:hypothetical protein